MEKQLAARVDGRQLVQVDERGEVVGVPGAR